MDIDVSSSRPNKKGEVETSPGCIHRKISCIANCLNECCKIITGEFKPLCQMTQKRFRSDFFLHSLPANGKIKKAKFKLRPVQGL